MDEGFKLIICAGDRHKPGYIHHDVQGEQDILCDFWFLSDFIKDESCDKIEFTHALEHFPMKDSVGVLHYIRKMLKPGGELYIEVPNFTWHAEEILADPMNRQIIEYAFGGQTDQYDFHYNGYTPEILAKDLEDAGFTIKELKPNSSIECVALKSQS